MGTSYLLEIGLEEMPAHIISYLQTQLAQRTQLFLDESGLAYTEVESFSTPRRLAIRIRGLSEYQADRVDIIKGPAKKIAKDAQGNWTKAAIGFSKGQGVDVSALVFKEVKGEEYVFVEKKISGQSVVDILPSISTIAEQIALPISMRWGIRTDRYIRPVHWIVSLLEDQIVPLQLFGIEASNTTRTHRFLGENIAITHPNQYEALMKEQYVIVDVDERQTAIKEQIVNLCKEKGWAIPDNQSLLDEITHLVEYPTVFFGTFDESFLEVPENILETSMADHQRYFPVRDQETTEFLPYFIAVRNGDANCIDNVVRGNEKVLAARLEDAKFFYESDKHKTIEAFVEQLKQYTYQKQLGSLYEKQQRVKAMVLYLAEQLNASDDVKQTLKRASDIYKFDLMTQVVGEFSKLQGYIGSVYAHEKGEPLSVAQAIAQQYKPMSAEGELPHGEAGMLLALVDKLEMVMLFFAVGLIPNGSNDPFALRRHTLGIIRIIEAYNLQLPIGQLLKTLITTINVSNAIKEGFNAYFDDLIQFIKDRLDQKMKDEYGVPHDIRQSLLILDEVDVLSVLNKAKVLKDIPIDSAYKAFVESFTRVSNMARTLEEVETIRPELFETVSERKLYEALIAYKNEHNASKSPEEQLEALRYISPLIQLFFEENMVNADDPQLKQNRQALIKQLDCIGKTFCAFDQLIVK